MLYTQRHSSYRAHQEALRIAEDLRQSQLRVLLSENAASMGRLAAALSHDFNSPIGALRSSAETLLSLAGRISPAPAEKREELLAALKELCGGRNNEVPLSPFMGSQFSPLDLPHLPRSRNHEGGTGSRDSLHFRTVAATLQAGTQDPQATTGIAHL
jgi:signal transduction histidine kinase